MYVTLCVSTFCALCTYGLQLFRTEYFKKIQNITSTTIRRLLAYMKLRRSTWVYITILPEDILRIIF